MKPLRAAALLLILGAGISGRAEAPPPRLLRQGTATQLIVDGQPLLIRGGEINNSSATNPDTLEPAWAKVKALNLNTLIVPAYWDLIEPAEGQFDFSTVDRVLQQARAQRMRLVLLWFGSWKNSMSCYVPAWIKQDEKRFPRVLNRNGEPQEILSPFSEENRRIDAAAFAALLRHLRMADGAHTVVMVQVENEIGMIPEARDYSPAANRAFAGPVPAEFMNYLAAHADTLAPGLRDLWSAAGGKRAGSWAEVFGGNSAGEEVFSAWYFARYTNAVTLAGKAEYPLPMYVNAALIRPGYQPGQYPSGGPLPHLMDVWHAGAPAIDLLAPDIYFRDFLTWARRYRRADNPLFIPEAQGSPDAAVNGLYAFGACDALGFSAFAIDTLAGPAAERLAGSYALVAQLEPLILAHQGNGTMAGLLSAGDEELKPQQVALGGYTLLATFERADAAVAAAAGGLVIASGPDEFIVAGTGLTITFTSNQPGATVGLLNCEEGEMKNGVWKNILWLSGDQTNQGRHIRLEAGRFSIQRVKLYRY